MAALKLKVKQELIDKDSLYAFSANGSSYCVKLKTATDAELELIYKTGHTEIFEPVKDDKKKE